MNRPRSLPGTARALRASPAPARAGATFLAVTLLAGNLPAQTYAPPAPGDYGGPGSFPVFVERFPNPVYPSANGETLTVSVYHPYGSIDPAFPTIFVAHGYTSPIGDAADYSALLDHLAGRGYNLVFSPYEGGVSATIFKRFDELVTGFQAAVENYGLNTNQVGFAGHSYGGGFLPAVIQHEMMDKADAFRAGHHWGAYSAFMFSMAPGYAYAGGGETGVLGEQTIVFPAQLNVVEQVYNDDTSIADPRVALDIFYNITTANGQKDFVTVHGDSHGTPAQTANHFLPNTGGALTSTSLQAWAIFRHIDALAAWTFDFDATARGIALGDGAPAETWTGTWSDGAPVAPLGATDLPDPSVYAPGPYLVQWDDAANPRGRFPLVSGPPSLTLVGPGPGQATFTATGLLSGHEYLVQSIADLTTGAWSNATSFVALESTQSITTVAVGNFQIWRLLAP